MLRLLNHEKTEFWIDISNYINDGEVKLEDALHARTAGTLEEFNSQEALDSRTAGTLEHFDW